MNIVSFGDILNVANVSSVSIISIIVIYDTRFKVSDVVTTKTYITTIECEVVATDCESSITVILNCVDIFQVFVQLNFESISTISFYIDVTSSALEGCRSCFIYAFTLNFYKAVQFMVVHCISVVTSEFQTIIQSSNFVFVVVFIFVYDTSDAIFAVYARLAIFSFHSKTIFTVFTIEADGAVFTIDNNGGTIFTVYADFTVNAVFTIFAVVTDLDIVGQSVFNFSTVIVASLFNSQVFTCCHFNCFTIRDSFCSSFRISSCITSGFHIPYGLCSTWSYMQVISNLVAVFSFVNCYGVIVGSYYCTSIFQLFYVNCISIVYACFHISNVQVTSVDTSFSYGWATCNC